MSINTTHTRELRVLPARHSHQGSSDERSLEDVQTRELYILPLPTRRETRLSGGYKTTAGKTASTKKARTKGRIAYDVVMTTIFSAFVAALVVAVASLVVVPRFLGATSLTVLTGSMEPTLPPGTIVVIQPRAVEDIRVGDVVTYQLESGRPEVVTHRVVGIRENASGEIAFTMRGDNNTLNDPRPVIEEQVRGVLIYAIPYLGLVVNFLDSSTSEIGATSATLPDMNIRLMLPILIGGIFIFWGFGYVITHFVGRKSAQEGNHE
ncbi:signal peptidase I [Lysinibacter sp. HNR]|uniref:signal peptidase I n=1 Tax=Lysinibacter sp. HNR TaxID=3031408 RepID=UPI0024358380|nr:signal peptidase I [Lysinibacter sp. HNR]WGD37945.1 signal peptidase I [Lysinibacter sp. HNR]